VRSQALYLSPLIRRILSGTEPEPIPVPQVAESTPRISPKEAERQRRHNRINDGIDGMIALLGENSQSTETKGQTDEKTLIAGSTRGVSEAFPDDHSGPGRPPV